MHTSSSSTRSWLASSTTPGRSRRNAVSSSMASSSRWLVGSSSSRHAGTGRHQGRQREPGALTSRQRADPHGAGRARRARAAPRPPPRGGRRPRRRGRRRGPSAAAYAVCPASSASRRAQREPLDVGHHPAQRREGTRPAPRRWSAPSRNGGSWPSIATSAGRSTVPEYHGARRERARRARAGAWTCRSRSRRPGRSAARRDGQVDVVEDLAGAEPDVETGDAEEGSWRSVGAGMREPFGAGRRTRRAVPRARVWSAEDPHDVTILATRRPSARPISCAPVRRDTRQVAVRLALCGDLTVTRDGVGAHRAKPRHAQGAGVRRRAGGCPRGAGVGRPPGRGRLAGPSARATRRPTWPPWRAGCAGWSATTSSCPARRRTPSGRGVRARPRRGRRAASPRRGARLARGEPTLALSAAARALDLLGDSEDLAEECAGDWADGLRTRGHRAAPGGPPCAGDRRDRHRPDRPRPGERRRGRARPTPSTSAPTAT